MTKENKPTEIKYQEAENMNWLRLAGTTGFAFFLVKGLAWIVVTVWAFY